jgi:MazG family protein
MSETFDELVGIMDRLREPGGCPWDREQDLDSMVKCLREELDEVVAAIAARDGENLKEEIGDLLFNLIFVARLGREEGWFTMEDCLAGIRDKIVRRHPHVFGEGTLETAEEVLAQWKRIKEEEKAGDEP